MKLIIGDSAYECDRKTAMSMVSNAQKYVKKGIYAVTKGNVAILKNESHTDDIWLDKSIKEYKGEGFKVYYNR